MSLGFIVGLSMIKDAYEDIKRKIADRAENNSNALVSTCNNDEKIFSFVQSRWQGIRVGQIIKVTNGQYFPCDMVLLNSSMPKGVCYVETKNLDGETNLKHKKPAKEVVGMASNDEEV